MKVPYSRRAFLQTTAAGIVSMSGGLLPGAVADATVNGSIPIIDCHTHFYDPARPQGVPWPGKEEKLLYRTVLPKHYRALPAADPVVGTVVVEASSWVEDNQWILDLADSTPFITGFVGNLPVGEAEFRGHLQRFARNPLFRGLRLGGDRIHSRLNDKMFLMDMEALAASDLAVDVLGGPEVLPVAARLARQVPELRIIIDHVANVQINGKAPPPQWVDGMKAVGQESRVYCKVSGLVEGTGKSDGTAPGDVNFYLPVLDAVWREFGPERLVYGSNWPVSEKFAPLARVQQIAHDYFSTKGRDAMRKVFSASAKNFYKWVQR